MIYIRSGNLTEYLSQRQTKKERKLIRQEKWREMGLMQLKTRGFETDDIYFPTMTNKQLAVLLHDHKNHN